MTIDYVSARPVEFVCTNCLLVHDRIELATHDGERICLDCA